ncbi:MAG: adenylate kinase [Acidimicrobiia bacterium]|nr:adenylate kinase [Acidimicrobiia bacterium]
MRRISIIGSSGSGKTTLAQILSDVLGIPHLELDSVYHQRGWKPLPDEDLRAVVRPLVEQSAWVIDGNYARTGVQKIIWARADTIVWLDLSRARTMWRVTVRSFGRCMTRQELWNGNRESWSNLVSRDPEENIIMWTWTRYASNRQRYVQDMAEAGDDGPTWFHLRTPREVDDFVAAVGSWAVEP